MRAVRWPAPALVGLLAVVLVSSAPGSAADPFAGTWTVHPSAGSPWAGGGTLTITTTTESNARAIGSSTAYESRCGKGATAFYIVEYSWSGGGKAGGCSGSQTGGDLFAFAANGGVQMNLNPQSDGSLAGYWTDTPGFYPGYPITATQPSDAGADKTCKLVNAQAAAVQNEVRVVAVEPDVQYHKGGSAAGAWLPVEKDTVLKQGDELTVDPDGRATLAFADNSTVFVKNTTQLKIASFFTDGGVVKTEILLKMGEVAAQVCHSEATKSDFRIKSPTAVASVRGTVFSVFVDPGGKAMVTDVKNGVVTVDPAKRGLHTASVRAGKEIEVTAASISRVAPIGKADVRGGVSRRQAAALVAQVLAKNNGPCKVTTERIPGLAVRPSPGGWRVSYKVGGALRGTTSWRVVHGHVTAANGLARKIAHGCP